MNLAMEEAGLEVSRFYGWNKLDKATKITEELEIELSRAGNAHQLTSSTTMVLICR